MVNTHRLKQNNQITYNIQDTTFQKVAVRHGSNTFSLVWNAEVSDELDTRSIATHLSGNLN